MTYLQTTVSSATNGGEIINLVRSELSNSGWTDAGSTWTKTANGKTMTISGFPNGGSFTSSSYHSMQIDGNLWAYFPVCTTLTGTGSFAVTISISDDMFYFAITGPTAGGVGGQDETYGSTRAFVLYTTIEPYWTTDTVADDKMVLIRSHATTSTGSFTPLVYVKKGLNAAAWSAGELMTMRPAVQDIPSVGDKPPSRAAGANYSTWPYVIIETASGIRGRVSNLWFAGEAYNLAGDSGDILTPSVVTIDGIEYFAERPFGLPSTSGPYSPLGVSNPSFGLGNYGPVVYIRKGAG